jgi:hypothetical protein
MFYYIVVHLLAHYIHLTCVFFNIIFNLNLTIRNLISLQQNKYYRKYYVDGISVFYQTSV